MPRARYISATAFALMMMVAAAAAQTPPGQAPAPAPAKPYKLVAVTLPAPNKDASLDAFRKQLTDVVTRKDRAALGKLVAPGFFWERESGDATDKKKSGIDNLAAAIGLDAKDGSGWDVLADYAGDQTAAPVPDRNGILCSPADPVFNEADLEAAGKATQTDPSEWGYPLSNGVEVRETALPTAKVTEKLGMHFVRVMPEDPPQGAGAFLRIVTPAGKIGFVPADSLAPLGNDQLCYAKDASGWKIAGYVGGGTEQ
jgi:hypothetical protein